MASVTASDFSKLSVVLTTMGGLNLEISKLVEQINIYQDVFAPCITGNVSLHDAAGIFDNMPIAGYETLTITLQTIDNGNPVTFEKTYRVFGVENYTVVKQNLKAYTIKFASEAAYTNRVQVCYNMRRLKTQEAIEKVLVDYLQLKPEQYEFKDLDGELQRPMIFGYLNPFSIIRKIVNKTLGKGTNASYLFYETKDKYVLNSIENIIATSTGATRTYNYVPATGDVQTRYSKDRMYAFRIESAFNRLEHELTGARVIDSVVHDLARKRQLRYTYDYKDKFTEVKHMDEYPFISDKEAPVESYRVFESAVSATLNRLVSGETSPHDVSARRTNQIQNLNTLKIIADVPGDLSNEIGDIVEVNLSSYVGNSAAIQKHKYLSGKYLLTAIHHVIMQDKYLQVLELTKDSLPDTLDIELTGEEFTG